MNYYDSLYGQQKAAVAMDKKSPSQTGEKIYVITCHDADGQLLKLLQAVRDTGNCGHSFDIVVDPDAEKKTTIFWDGDGSDRISSITSNNAELDLRKVLLANINTMRYIARPAIPDPDEPDKKLDDPIEALKKIEYTCDALLDGNSIDFGYGAKEMLDFFIEKTNEYIKACDAVPKEWNQNWTPKEGFEHMLWCFKHYYYERMVKSLEVEMPEEGKAVAKDEDIDYGKTLAKIEEEFISEAKKIGRKHECFFEAIRDDGGLYIQLQPAMDFTKGYKYEPGNQERKEDFEKFRKELDALAERLGCKRMEYTCNPNSMSMSRKDKDGREYMNFLVTSVKESVWKKAGREAAKKG